MAGVDRVDLPNRFGDFAERMEGDDAVAAGAKNFRKAGFLGDDGAAGGEIAGAAVAEPTGIEPDVLVLGDGELAFRAADVIAVETVLSAEIVRSAEAPAVAEEFGAGLVILDVGGQLEGFARFFGR